MRILKPVVAGLLFVPAISNGMTPPSGGMTNLPCGALVEEVNASPLRAESLNSALPAERLGEWLADGGPWLHVTTEGWLVGTRGVVGMDSRTPEVRRSVGSAWGQIADVRGGAFLHVEAGYGRIGLWTDLAGLNLQTSGDGTRSSIDATTIDLVGFLRVLDGGCSWLDVFAGARSYHVEHDTTILRPGAHRIAGSDSWWDPVVGMRSRLCLGCGLGLIARADVGGFGWGDSSDQACQLAWGIDYRCSDCLSIAAGYRWFHLERRAGLADDRFVFDALLQGPFLNFAFRF